MYFSGKQLDFIISKSLEDFVFLYFDATGKIVGMIPGDRRYVLYYALILPAFEDYGTLPIAEFISTVQSTQFISIFLMSVITAIKQRTSCKRKVICKIEVDFAMASIQAIMRSCNDTTLSNHLTVLYELIKIPNYQLNVPSFIVVHICSVHILRALSRKLHQLTRSRDIHQIAKMFISQLITACDMEKADRIFRDMVLVFGTKNEAEEITSAIKKMSSMYTDENFPKLEAEDEKSSEDRSTSDVEDIESGLRHGSPFYKHFHGIMESVGNKMNNKKCCNNEKANKYFLPEFLRYLMEYYMPFFPLWSAIIICCFNITEDTNQAVESWFKTLKHFIHQLKTRIQVARFVQQLAENIKPRLMRRYSLTTERQRKNRIEKKLNETKSVEQPTKDNDKTQKKKKRAPWDLASESWNRGRTYFITPKTVDKAKEARLDEQEQRTSLATQLPGHRNENDKGTEASANLRPFLEPKNLTELKNVDKYPDGFPVMGDTVVLGHVLQ